MFQVHRVITMPVPLNHSTTHATHLLAFPIMLLSQMIARLMLKRLLRISLYA